MVPRFPRCRVPRHPVLLCRQYQGLPGGAAAVHSDVRHLPLRIIISCKLLANWQSLALVSLLELLGMVALVAAVAANRRWIELEDANPLAALTLQPWVQIADGDFDVPIPVRICTGGNNQCT